MEKKTHIADTGVKAKSEKLKGTRIAMAVCGGIGSVEVVKIIREIRRHGARVTAFFTPSVEDFISELSVEWACGEKVVKQVGADVDHLDVFNLVVVAPATLNTLSKCALGIADNPVTLLVAGQLGRRAPLMVVPTMNGQLQNHPLYSEYLGRLKKWGAVVLTSELEEDRLKMPTPERLVAEILEMF